MTSGQYAELLIKNNEWLKAQTHGVVMPEFESTTINV